MKKDKKKNSPKSGYGEEKKDVKEVAESSAVQNTDAAGTSSESDKAKEATTSVTEPTQSSNSEGSAYQTSVSGSAEGEALQSASDSDSKTAGEGAGPEQTATPEIAIPDSRKDANQIDASPEPSDSESKAEFAQSLTPGEETMFIEEEKNAADIAADSGADAESAEKSKGEEKSKKPKSDTGIGYYLRVAGTLTIICTCIAGLLAVVNAVTADRIEANKRREAEAAIASIFTEFDSTEELAGEYASPVTGVTAVKKDGQTIGYCVFASPKGFKSSISLAVGISASHKVSGVVVLSMSETPGVGTRVGDASFLNRFKGKTSDMTLGGNVDALAGATISSKAVFNGVQAALAEVAAISEPIEIDGEASATEETDGEAHATDETDGEAHATEETDGEAHATEEGSGETNAAEETDGEAHATEETGGEAQTDGEASATTEGGGE